MLDHILRSAELIVEDAEIVSQALRKYQSSSSADFADCLIERSNHAAGCKCTITFDRDAVKAAGMKLLA